jgi:hypothetical protein
MSDSSPLIPRGSLLEQQSKSRPHLRIALCIVAGHLVFLGGLLMQGCKRDDPGEMATGTGLPTLELTNTVAPMPLDVVPVPRDTPRFPAPIEPELTPSLPVLPPARDLPPPQWEEATPPPPPPVRQELPPPVEPRSVTEHTVVQGDTFYGLGAAVWRDVRRYCAGESRRGCDAIAGWPEADHSGCRARQLPPCGERDPRRASMW